MKQIKFLGLGFTIAYLIMSWFFVPAKGNLVLASIGVSILAVCLFKESYENI
jgi:hypothetical protein